MDETKPDWVSVHIDGLRLRNVESEPGTPRPFNNHEVRIDSMVKSFRVGFFIIDTLCARALTDKYNSTFSEILPKYITGYFKLHHSLHKSTQTLHQSVQFRQRSRYQQKTAGGSIFYIESSAYYISERK